MDTFHDDARRASSSGSGTGNGHRTRRGSACRRGLRWRPPQVTGASSTTNAPGSKGKFRTSPVFPAIETSLDRTASTVPENRLPRCTTRIPTWASTIGYMVASRSRGPTGPARMPPEICRDSMTVNVATRPLHQWPLRRIPTAPQRSSSVFTEPRREPTRRDRAPSFDRQPKQALALAQHGCSVLVPIGMLTEMDR